QLREQRTSRLDARGGMVTVGDRATAAQVVAAGILRQEHRRGHAGFQQFDRDGRTGSLAQAAAATHFAITVPDRCSRGAAIERRQRQLHRCVCRRWSRLLDPSQLAAGPLPGGGTVRRWRVVPAHRRGNILLIHGSIEYAIAWNRSRITELADGSVCTM